MPIIFTPNGSLDVATSSEDLPEQVDGKVAQFSGFNIIPTERIGIDSSSDHKVLFWAKGGMLLGLGKDITTKIDQRADKNYATQVFASMTIGATRMEEARVGYIACDPSTGPGA